MSDLCREFGISRKTGYKYVERYESNGLDALKDQSRAPKNHPNAVQKKVAELILSARKSHPSWGPRKLLASLQGRYPKIKSWPCASTVGNLLKREGLVRERKRRRISPKHHQQFPLAHAENPNDVWCADFKGWFTVGNGQRCDPLTISDASSRFLLECHAVRKTNVAESQKAFERIFREYGLPVALRTDNGAPFAARGLGGLTQLAVWWLKLGIRLERIEPGKPHQNGRHERMHLTLKQATALPPRSSVNAQQKAFDRFRYEYNHERPHEALKNRFPGEVYYRSEREYPERIPEMEYQTNIEPMRVRDDGTILYATCRVHLTAALRGEVVGLEDISDRHRRIHFGTAALGVLDIFTGKVLRYRNPMPIITI